MPKFTARILREEDIPDAAQWITQNPDIPDEDKRMVSYPSAITITVEKDGKPIMHVPMHIQFLIGFLGFSPEMHPKDKAAALRCAMDAAKKICQAMGMAEIHVCTKPEYPMGKWALKHGFVDTNKNDFYLKANDHV